MATVDIDIAGLVKGASKGEGLEISFRNIRECNYTRITLIMIICAR
jgi:ribosome-binding ATPase YchF (GTP1/OBG family)